MPDYDDDDERTDDERAEDEYEENVSNAVQEAAEICKNK